MNLTNLIDLMILINLMNLTNLTNLKNLTSLTNLTNHMYHYGLITLINFTALLYAMRTSERSVRLSPLRSVIL